MLLGNIVRCQCSLVIRTDLRSCCGLCAHSEWCQHSGYWNSSLFLCGTGFSTVPFLVEYALWGHTQRVENVNQWSNVPFHNLIFVLVDHENVVHVVSYDQRILVHEVYTKFLPVLLVRIIRSVKLDRNSVIPLVTLGRTLTLSEVRVAVVQKVNGMPEPPLRAKHFDMLSGWVAAIYYFILRYPCPTLYSFVQLCTAMYNSVQLCTTLYSFVQLCTALYNFVQACTTLDKKRHVTSGNGAWRIRTGLLALLRRCCCST